MKHYAYVVYQDGSEDVRVFCDEYNEEVKTHLAGSHIFESVKKFLDFAKLSGRVKTGDTFREGFVIVLDDDLKFSRFSIDSKFFKDRGWTNA